MDEAYVIFRYARGEVALLSVPVLRVSFIRLAIVLEADEEAA